jgi:signal transduction histidine kinase
MAVATDTAADPRSPAPARPAPEAEAPEAVSWSRRIAEFLPRGNTLEDDVWRKRHAILQWFLLLHLPALVAFGFYMKHSPSLIFYTVAPIAVLRILGGLPTGRRLASFFTTAGIVYCSAALVVLANGAIEAHFHFFIIIGFIALYQDWVPFLWNIAFTVLSHGLGSAVKPTMMFDHLSGMEHPWRWSIIHGVAVLAACVGMILFWRTNEDEQQKTLRLTEELGEAEINRRRFTSELLVNLARRNQSLLYRQLDIINQLEHQEQDADALAGLFRLDHLATRIRRNAENLLVLSGEEPPRIWGKPVALSDVVRAAIAETEDLSRVTFVIDERLAILGHAVIDLTHLLAELIENAVRSSPPDSQVTLRTTPDVRSPGTVMLTVEDWGVGMPAEQLEAANLVLSTPHDVDALMTNRLGLHVVSRLAGRYSIRVVLTTTSGSGITAVVLLPPDLFTAGERPRAGTGQFPAPAQLTARAAEPPSVSVSVSDLPGPAHPEPVKRRRPAPVVQHDPRPTPPSFPAVGSPGSPAARPQPVANSAPTPPAGVSGPRATPPRPPQARRPSRQTFQIGPQQTFQVDVPAPGPDWGGWWDPEDDHGPAARPGAGNEAATGDPRRRDPRDPRDPREGRPLPPPTGPTQVVPGPVDEEPPAPGQSIRLTRRRPQTHLAPELQRDHGSQSRTPAAAASPPGPPPDAERAREALSRYQASRRAALAENDSSERKSS